eukprot:m.186567 g.186567  ORF g.186567 m.186567 type:complete len:162 (-) comp25593_c1_seq10:954-1439(-)
MLGVGFNLSCVCSVQLENMPTHLNYSDLQSQTNTKIRDFLLACPFTSGDFTLNASATKATWYDNATGSTKSAPCIMVLDGVLFLISPLKMRRFHKLGLSWEAVGLSWGNSMLGIFQTECVAVLALLYCYLEAISFHISPTCKSSWTPAFMQLWLRALITDA